MSTPPRKTKTPPTKAGAQVGPAAEPLASSPFVKLHGLPEVEPLTAVTFAALPKKKISALWTRADGKSGDALRARLAPLTNCANYLICIGWLGVAARRSHVVIEPKLYLALPEMIFAYQLDWRYPKPFGITMTDLDEATPEVALRRAYSHAFFSQIARTPSFFLSGSAQPMASYMVTLTRHLLGKQAAPYDAWLDAMIARLTKVAADPTPEASSSIYDYPSREDWEAAVRVSHGQPLPLELLDVAAEAPSESDWPALVAATFARFSPETNPLLQPAAALVEKGLATPYGASA
jgi:hypothetical protein